jgi:hypothetical protein
MNMQYASDQELDVGLNAAYDRASELRVKMVELKAKMQPGPKAQKEFANLKVELDRVIDDINAMDAEKQRRWEDRLCHREMQTA